MSRFRSEHPLCASYGCTDEAVSRGLCQHHSDHPEYVDAPAPMQEVKSCTSCDAFMSADWIGDICYACDTAHYQATGRHVWESAPVHPCAQCGRDTSPGCSICADCEYQNHLPNLQAINTAAEIERVGPIAFPHVNGFSDRDGMIVCYECAHADFIACAGAFAPYARVLIADETADDCTYCDHCSRPIDPALRPAPAADFSDLEIQTVTVDDSALEGLVARKTACDWHGGQASLMYALCSTGMVVNGVQYEISHTRENTPNPDEYNRLTKLREYCMARIRSAGAIVALALCIGAYAPPVGCTFHPDTNAAAECPGEDMRWNGAEWVAW